MINRDFKQFLQKITSERLQNNLLANVISIYYENLDSSLSKDKFYENILKYYKIHRGFVNIPKFNTQEFPKEDILNKDFRVSSLRISNFRGFPEPKQEIHYGIDFKTNESKNANLIVLGRNGSGKSSLFAALEYIYTNSISEAQLRSHKTLEGKHYDKFITYLNNDLNKVTCKIKTNYGDFNNNNKIFNNFDSNVFNPKTHFISDHRIIENGKLEFDENTEISFHNLIAKNLGLGEFLDFQNTLETLKNYKRLKEKTEKSRHEKERQLLEDEISSWSNEIKKNELMLQQLENKLNNEFNLKDNNLRNDLFLIQQRKKISINIEFDIKQITLNFNNFLNEITKFQSLSKRHLNENEIQFLRSGKELLKEYNDCPFCLNSKSSLEEIKNEVESRLKLTQEYLNQIQIVENAFFELQNLFGAIFSKYIEIKSILRDDIKLLAKFLFLNSLIDSENKILREFENIYLDRNYEIYQVYESVNKPDIITLGQFHSYVLSFEDFFINKNSTIIPALKSLERERASLLGQLENTLTEELVNPSEVNEIIKLNYELDTLKSRIKSNQNEIKQIDRLISAINDEIIIFNEIVTDTIQFYNIVASEISNIIINSTKPIKETIENILIGYVKTNNPNYELDLKIDIENKTNKEGYSRNYISAKIIHVSKVTGEISYVTPDKFFNTFRYRLFCTMVSLSLAIASRINNKVNLPFVIDDIFYSSDYGQRVDFELFFDKFINIFKEYDNLKNIQFILFTHDEVIFESVINTLIVNPELYNSTIFSKLYPSDDLEDMPQGLEGDKYWELIYRLPNLIRNTVNS